MRARTLVELDDAARLTAGLCGVWPEWALAWMRLSRIGGISDEEDRLLLERDGPAKEIAKRCMAEWDEWARKHGVQHFEFKEG